MRKILLLILSLVMFACPLYAVSSSDVYYDIEDYIVDAQIDSAGNLNVREIIKLDGTFNGYIRDLIYRNDNINSFNGEDIDFSGSDIYNASNIEIYKVGKISWNGELSFDAFNEEVEDFTKGTCITGSKACYEESTLYNGVSIKMFNETNNSSTYFYIEYLVANAVVIHEDVSELYYNFIGYNFDDLIKNYQLRVSLPQKTDKQIKVWAHGPLNGEVYLLSETEDDSSLIYSGAYLKINNLSANTPVDIRMTFPNELISVRIDGLTKYSNTDALEKILKIEEERADEANQIRERAKTKVTIVYLFSGLYLILTGVFFVYIYLKHDKEVRVNFDSEYNREFIDDYDVTVIEYLFDKRITEKAFSTSILNLIYKKNILVEEIIDGKKKDYKFTKVYDAGINEAESKLMKLIFSEAGNGNEVTLSSIKKYAKNISGTSSPFLNSYNDWNYTVKDDAIKENFYENNTGTKALFFLHPVIGMLLFFLHFRYGIYSLLTLLIILLSIIFVIYLIKFTKKTPKGALHYAKWKAFKRFLEDFGRFNEKELPEIALWERYLVYANIFGIADKVSKTMKIKFNEIGYNSDNGDMVFDYLIWSNLNDSINKTVSSSISTAHSKVSEAIAASSSSSSGGGFGGGFSSGGGFGGGGGGGRGF